MNQWPFFQMHELVAETFGVLHNLNNLIRPINDAIQSSFVQSKVLRLFLAKLANLG